ncbi:hypothetical protein ACFOW1_09650 [Parasediminibacterium paludis]|uniref:Uncharacterized protein n=1 Tax=Parasediminibacterium paludis TaxID=908966 RepID=A0ABV8PXY8_9BACT
MSNHTPGPWILTNGTHGIYVHVINEAAKYPYKIIAQYEFNEVDALANAKLIAAAPDMLEALQAAIKLSDENLAANLTAGYDATRTPECQAVYDQVKAAIEKAIL